LIEAARKKRRKETAMAVKKTAVKAAKAATKKAKRKPSARAKAARRTAGDRIRDTWAATLSALTSAEAELEKQIRTLMKRNNISGKDAKAALDELRARADRERKKALGQLEGSLKKLKGRIGKERKSIARLVEDGIQSALAALNIPSRQEVADLTSKVEQLSRKIDSVRRK